jgi:hypothetical protein
LITIQVQLIFLPGRDKLDQRFFPFRYDFVASRWTQNSSSTFEGLSFFIQAMFPSLQLLCLQGWQESPWLMWTCLGLGKVHPLPADPTMVKDGVSTANAQCLGAEQFPMCMWMLAMIAAI